jgi:hypothetical protein
MSSMKELTKHRHTYLDLTSYKWRIQTWFGDSLQNVRLIK